MDVITQDEIRLLLSALDGVRVMIGSESLGSPESAWGDTFCFYDPDGTENQKLPFATIVTRDTPGWDEVSDLDRPGAFRLNLAVGRTAVPQVDGEIDHRQEDVVLPHPHYAPQGWISIVNPRAANTEQVRALIAAAYDRAVERHR